MTAFKPGDGSAHSFPSLDSITAIMDQDISDIADTLNQRRTAQGLAPFTFELAFRKSLTIQTSVGTQAEPGLRSFHEAVAAIAAGEYEVDYLLAPTYAVEQIQEAIEAARARRGVKVSITFGER